MPQNIPVGYGQATYSFSHEASNRPLAITLGVSLPDPGTSPTAVANALFTRFTATVLPDLDNGLTLTEVNLFIGNGDDPSGSVQSDAPPQAGGRSMVSAPLNTAVLVTKTTGFLGRRARGRMSVPSSAPRDDVSEIGNLSDTLLNSLNSSWADFYDALVDGDVAGDPLPGESLFPVILHATAPFVPTPVTGFKVERKIATRPSRIR